MKIFGVEVSPGQKVTGYTKVGELANFSEIKLPFLVVRGREDGPTLWLTGAVHGDELNGPWAMRRIFAELRAEELRGTVVLTPLLNPMAFLARTKTSNLDNLDMDQQFPGNPAGLYSERVAHAVFTEIKAHADYVIDFHTLGHLFSATPYTVSKIVPGASEETADKAFALARVFGVYPNCRVDLGGPVGELPGTTGGSIDILCIRNNIPCFMAEMGGGGRWEEDAIAAAYSGIRNVLAYLQMTGGDYRRPDRQLIITGREFLRSNRGGLMRMAVEPGTILHAGETLATVYSFWEELETIKAEKDIFIIATRFEPTVSTGDRLAFVGTSWQEKEWQ